MLILVTLGIGWAIWALITASNGQTPAKSLMNMQAVDVTTGRPLSFGHYVIIRGGIATVIGLVAGATVIGLLVYLMPLFNDKNQQLWGMATNSTYVDV